jgi:hypothetical protein
MLKRTHRVLSSIMTTTYDFDYGINRDSLFVNSKSDADYRIGSFDSYLNSGNSNDDSNNSDDSTHSDSDSEHSQISAEMIEDVYASPKKTRNVKAAKNKRIVKVRKNINNKGNKEVRNNCSKTDRRTRTGSKTGSKSGSKVRQSSTRQSSSKQSLVRTKNTTFIDSNNMASVLNSQLMTRSKMSRNKKYAKTDKDGKNVDKTDSKTDSKTPLSDSKNSTNDSALESETNTRSTDNSIDTGDSEDTKSSQGSKRKKDKETIPIRVAIKSAVDRSRYVKVRRFFRDSEKCSKENVQLMVDIINKNHEISLRTINWFGTKHLDTMDSRYRTKENGERELFDPKITYGKRIGNYGKKGFDPFRRGLAFDWNYDTDDKAKTVTTTLCQLQFFQWIFEYELMDYILNNLSKLKDMMRKSEKKKKEIKKAKKEKKDKEKEAHEHGTKEDKKNVKLKAKRSDTRAESKLIIKIG